MTVQKTDSPVALAQPSGEHIPAEYRQDVLDMFSTWTSVRGRNRTLRDYYTGHVAVKNLGVAIPPSFEGINVVSGWPAKAIHAHAMRSIFDGFVFAGEEDAGLKRLVERNRLRSLYQQAVASSLVYGVSFLTVMAGTGSQPAAKVRLFDANQACALWDSYNDRIKCGIVLAGQATDGTPTRYVAHFSDAVLTFDREGAEWSCHIEPNPMGRPMMEAIVNDPDPERPFGHSMLTPELLGIVDKAMRDVLRMEVGAEFFTAPQRYVLGASEDLFGAPADESDDVKYYDMDGNEVDRPAEPSSDMAKLKAYYGAMWAITRDENGDVPTVGEFSAPGASNFISVFENDAQRFSGATNVPLAQLGVLSNNYTSSDALGAANDPLILEVETMNRRNAEAMEEIARMMMCVNEGKTYAQLGERAYRVQCYLRDPSKSTFAANADGWTKIGQIDNSLIGTDVMYEGFGFSQPTIDRIHAQKSQAAATQTMAAISDRLTDLGIQAAAKPTEAA